MDHSLTEALNLVEFSHIIVNTDWESIYASLDNNNKEESKQCHSYEIHSNKDNQEPTTSRIYSVKIVTKNKTEANIVDLIKTELSIVDNDISIWNRMMIVIAKLRISRDNQIIGNKI